MPDPSGSTGVQPSAEAIEVAQDAAVANARKRGWTGNYLESWAIHDDARTAARAVLAIDAPAIHAAGQDGAVWQVRDLIGCVERHYTGDAGPLAMGAREALADLRTQLDLRFGEARFPSEGTT